MQNDLISRSAVMEMLTNIELSCTPIPMIEAKLQLRDIPCAYDVEKVVAEIGLLDFKTHRVMRETGINSEVFEIVRVDKYVRLDEVLDIIRNGGKE